MTVFIQQICLGGAADDGSQRIEDIDEQEREDNDDEVKEVRGDETEVELQERGCHGSRHGYDRGRKQRIEACVRIRNVETGELADDAQDPGDQDTEQHVALDALDQHIRGNERADQSQNDSDTFIGECSGSDRTAEREQTDQGGAADDDMRVLHADEGDEETDADGNGDFQSGRDGIEDRFTDVGQRKDDEDQTFHQDRCQSDLPGITHTAADGVCEVRIQTHTGGQSERQIGEQSHAQTCDRGCNGSRCEDGALVHTGSAQDVRVDGQNVDHRHERCQTGDDLSSGIGVVLFQLEQFF